MFLHVSVSHSVHWGHTWQGTSVAGEGCVAGELVCGGGHVW